MINTPISRYPVPDLNSLPEDILSRIMDVQEKAHFVPNVFLTLAYRPAEHSFPITMLLCIVKGALLALQKKK